MILSELIDILKKNSFVTGNFKNSNYYIKNSEEEIKAGIYLRRSKNDRKSIDNQVISVRNVVIDEFGIEENNIKLYQDNGVSGTLDKRPAYLNMKRDLLLGTINTVIVANVDRMGRTTEVLLQDIYPDLEIRYLFISIDDLIINSMDNRESFLEKIKDADMYAALTSRKVRRVLKARMKSGSSISAKAPYGYKIVEEGGIRSLALGNTLEIENAKMIFSQYASGKSLGDIVKLLYEHKIKSPSGNDSWSKSTIKSILENPIYMGDFYQGRYQKQSYLNSGSGKQVKKIDPSEWIDSGKCPAIVDKHTFQQVKDMLEENKRVRTSSGERHLFTGLLRCGDCKLSLIFRKKSMSYQCSGSLKAPYKCSSHLVSEEDLKAKISPRILNQLNNIDDNIINSVKRRINMVNTNDSYKADLKALDDEIEQYVEKLIEVDKKSSYSNIMIRKIEEKIKELEKSKELINKEIDSNNNLNKRMNYHFENLNVNIDNNEVYRLFIKEIRIYGKGEIEIDWKNGKSELL